VQPHSWDLSTSNSHPGEDGSKPCSISQRAACRLRNGHHARITRGRRRCRSRQRRRQGAPPVRASGCRHHPLELGTGSATDPPSLRSCVGEV